MKVLFNNEELESKATTLLELLTEKDLDKKRGIAVALNNEVISRSNWNKTELKDNDKILIITATQGG